MAHTPGPWVYRPKSGVMRDGELHPMVIGPNDENPICVMEGDWEDEHDNARLIAAAPELLTVLETLMAKRTLYGGLPAIHGLTAEDIRDANVAIRKAHDVNSPTSASGGRSATAASESGPSTE